MRSTTDSANLQPAAESGLWPTFNCQLSAHCFTCVSYCLSVCPSPCLPLSSICYPLSGRGCLLPAMCHCKLPLPLVLLGCTMDLAARLMVCQYYWQCLPPTCHLIFALSKLGKRRPPWSQITAPTGYCKSSDIGAFLKKILKSPAATTVQTCSQDAACPCRL